MISWEKCPSCCQNNNAPKNHFILIQKMTYMEMPEISHSILLEIHNTNWKEKESFFNGE